MTTFGFRPPQFSEDVAWLPAWLQPHQPESSNSRVNESQISTTQDFKNLAFLRGKINEGRDMDMLAREEGRYNSCHLFLSGEDNSPISFAPSPTNVLHFRLHLSSDGDSQYNQSQRLYTSQAKYDSGKAQSMQQVKTSTGVGEKTPESKTDSYAGGENLLMTIPRTMDDVGPQSPINSTDYRRQYEEKFNVRYLKDADINGAVELSVAASEALVIHELVKSGSASEALPTAAVLEAALRVKQARLEGLEDAFHYPSEEIDEIDFLSDLDDLTMANAFEDVGLFFSGPDDHGLDVSQVKDTPMSENNHGCDNEFNHVELMAKQKKLSEDPALGLKTSISASHVDPILHQSAQEISDVSVAAQKVGFVTQVDVNTSHAKNSENAEVRGKVSSFDADRFRSRWLGGWTGKEVDASSQLQQNNTNIIPKIFVGETSFLSESADAAPDENSFVQKLETMSKIASQSKIFIGETSFLSESADAAPDENSFVQKHETMSKIASQSSVPFEGFCDKDDEGILVSQDPVRSSNLSLVDPLCSVVPCSISLENADSLISQNQTNREVAAGNCFSPTSELQTENLLWTSGPNVESAYGYRQHGSKVIGECSLAPIRRQLTSLKTYSRVLAKHDAILERGRLVHNRSFPSECDKELLSSEQNMGCISSSSKRDSEGFFPLRPLPESTNGRDNEENHNSTEIRNQVVETTYGKIHNNKPAEDGAELQAQPSKKSRSPLILNRRMCRRLQASKLLVCNSIGKKNPDNATVQETTVEPPKSINLQKIQSECNKPRIAQVPMRKRVHFQEVEVEVEQDKGLQKLQSSHTNCSTIKASKRSKYSNTFSDSRTQSVKRCFTSCIKDSKRLIFQGIEFLLTGFSSKKAKEIEGLIRKYGGIVLFDIPPPLNLRGKRSSGSHLQQLPVVLCSKKLQTTKFLYGCAVNAFKLNVKWLTDSIAAGSIVQPEKYMILSGQTDVKITRIGKPVRHDNYKCMFHKVGIMLHGKQSFCTKLAIIFKHGGGKVFKTLLWLAQGLDTKKISAGAIVAEDESRASRHLRHCALERKIPMMPASWIIKSLHLGKLLPFTENKHTQLPTVKVPEFPISLEWSEEI